MKLYMHIVNDLVLPMKFLHKMNYCHSNVLLAPTSLSTVVLNSSYQQGKLWLNIKMHPGKQPYRNDHLKN